ncbi:MAG TPA: aspartate aminotransferase family protein [Gammaproteobacteria bacterium]|nr:aspartate aminotransferase family protein [Gammaproteobacteria bacterium]
MTEALIPTYNRLPVAFSRGSGAWLWSEDGTRYLDALSGIAVTGLGHAHPGVTRAIQEQAARLLHCSNIYRIPAQSALADRLCAHSGMSAAFFCNSGAEANEAAIKLARLHGHRRGHTCPRIVVMERAFHGRTLATLSATGNPKVQVGFEPLVEGFLRVPYGDVAAVAALFDRHPDIAAVLLESIQGEGGVIVPATGFLSGLRELCDRHGALLMLDEVQSGIGRTGRWFACQHEGVVPDVMQLAKGLGNGVPIGATLVHGLATDLFGPGLHGTTFGGNPLACAAALAVLDAIEQEDLLTRATALGTRIAAGLRAGLAAFAEVSVRGRGLMIGVVLPRDCPELALTCLETQHLLVNVTAGRVVRLLPPLVMTDAEADELVARLLAVLEPWLSVSGLEQGVA